MDVYRRILSGQPDSSIVICSIGFFTNLAALLESAPDDISPLGGKELVSKKVRRLVAMAGSFPEGEEYNVTTDIGSAKKVAEEWPVEIVFSGFEIGREVWTGKALVEMAESAIKTGESSGPVVEAYASSLILGEKNGHNSWDGTAMLIALKGHEPFFSLHRGKFIIKDTKSGENGWEDSPHGPHAYVEFKKSPEEIGALIDSLTMSHPLLCRNK